VIPVCLEHIAGTCADEVVGVGIFYIFIGLKCCKNVGVSFDSFNGESFYSDKMPAVVEELKEKNLLKLDDGASLVDLEAYKTAMMTEVNRSMPAYSKINLVEVMDQPFEKTPKMSIKRFLYN
jgi:hypothetical protein